MTNRDKAKEYLQILLDKHTIFQYPDGSWKKWFYYGGEKYDFAELYEEVTGHGCTPRITQ